VAVKLSWVGVLVPPEVDLDRPVPVVVDAVGVHPRTLGAEAATQQRRRGR
jgi:hypothetical protein